MKTIAVQDLNKVCAKVAVVDLPQMGRSVTIFNLLGCVDISSFFVVFSRDIEKKHDWENVKLLTHLQFKKFRTTGEHGGERFLVDMSKQYPETADCKMEIENVLLRVVRDHLNFVKARSGMFEGVNHGS